MYEDVIGTYQTSRNHKYSEISYHCRRQGLANTLPLLVLQLIRGKS